MNKRIFFVVVVAAAAFLTRPGQATEWHVLGARAMGMGGAGVAVAEGPVSAYWNPALLGRSESPSGVQVPVDAHMELTGQFLEGANDVHDISNDCQNSSVGPGNGLCTQANINAAIAKLNDPSNGLRGDVAAGAHVKIKRLAVFVNNMDYVAAIPKADTVDITPTNFKNGINNSELLLRGLSVTEIGAGYGRELPFVPGLFVGANLKILVGKAGYHDFFLNQNSAGSSNALNKFLEGANTSVQPGVDLGALWNVGRTFDFTFLDPRIGITSRDINNPQFSNPDQAKLAGSPSSFSLQGNTRLGVVISPFSFWHIAADADLTRNLTPVGGNVASQNVGLGTEVNVFNQSWFNLPLRVGLARNLAQAGSKTSLTGGFGLNFLHFMVDVAAMVSPSTVQIKSDTQQEKIPSNISVAAQIGVLFGGEKETKKTKEE